MLFSSLVLVTYTLVNIVQREVALLWPVYEYNKAAKAMKHYTEVNQRTVSDHSLIAPSTFSTSCL